MTDFPFEFADDLTTRLASCLDVEGKITIGSGDLELRNAVQQAVNDGAKNLLINLGKVTTLDSSGTGTHTLSPERPCAGMPCAASAATSPARRRV